MATTTGTSARSAAPGKTGQAGTAGGAPGAGDGLPGQGGPGSGAVRGGAAVRGSGTDALSVRVDALGELLGLSRTRISPDALAETGELLERVGERRRLSLDHTVVALAGATGSGKSTLFNALAGAELSRTGVRRPTTARPIACAWQPERAAGLLDRLGIAPQDRFARRGTALPGERGRDLDRGPDADRGFDADRAYGGGGAADGPGADAADGPGADAAAASVGAGAASDGAASGGAADLDGLVLIDLPDHDSAAAGHRDHVDRLLGLVDVVVWVLDPEKYADAALHERYLRPLSGHADVTVLVLNQIDRLPGDSADLVLDDLRRLLDEDGLAVGEHGEDGAVVLSASALTGEGIADLRAVLAQLVADRAAAGLRLAADMDRTASRLHPLYVGEGGAGLTDAAREEFVDRLADAVGAAGAGQAAERDWAAAAEEACGTPWGRLFGDRAATGAGSPGRANRAGGAVLPGAARTPGGAGTPRPRPAALSAPSASRPVVDEAVRGVVADAGRGLP
ncbi:GTPase, partial [Actinacidiphila alni]|uniref:GTPase n=1 Tax=Actinacidiphila alni TaxID=380248 RepID=UPI00340B0862